MFYFISDNVIEEESGKANEDQAEVEDESVLQIDPNPEEEIIEEMIKEEIEKEMKVEKVSQEEEEVKKEAVKVSLNKTG